MLPAGWVVLAVIAAVLLTIWVMSTLTRLDRLYARVAAARVALDGQLVRRAVAVEALVASAGSALEPEFSRKCLHTVQRSLAAADLDRAPAENALSRITAELARRRPQFTLAAQDELDELVEAATRVAIARRFYNGAVRDTRTLMGRKMPRLLHLTGKHELPRYFDIEDDLNILPESEDTAA